MKQLIKWEELSIFILSIFLVYKLNFKLEWWQYFLLFFTPDIGMIGYLIDTKWGAITYNILHHKASSTVLILCGLLLTNDWLLVIGLLFFAHAAFDRVLGFGLKYSDDFKHTNIGYMK
ncbi:MAG: DUF4260 domain-containing protein [Saprospiraceae bacterium]